MAEVICGADPTQGGLNSVHVKKGTINKLFVDAEISEGTKTIGNVKIEDAITATKVNVAADAGKNAIYVCSNSLSTLALQNEQQAKLTNISSKLSTINTSLSEINVKVTKEVVKKIYIFQEVTNPYIFGGNKTHLLMENPSPSNLINGVDFLASASFSNTSTASVYDKVFVCTEKTNKSITHSVRGVITIGVKRVSGNGTVYFNKIKMNIGYIDNTGTFTSVYNADATHTYSTISETYVNLCLQDFVGITNDYSLANRRFAVRVNIFAHVNPENTVGQLGMYHTRGSADSYVEVELK